MDVVGYTHRGQEITVGIKNYSAAACFPNGPISGVVRAGAVAEPSEALNGYEPSPTWIDAAGACEEGREAGKRRRIIEVLLLNIKRHVVGASSVELEYSAKPISPVKFPGAG